MKKYTNRVFSTKIPFQKSDFENKKARVYQLISKISDELSVLRTEAYLPIGRPDVPVELSDFFVVLSTMQNLQIQLNFLSYDAFPDIALSYLDALEKVALKTENRLEKFKK